jgi:hypothetical protein
MISTPNNVIKSIKMANDSLVEIIFNDDVQIELEDLKIGYQYLNEVTGGKRLKKLVISGNRTTISKDARLFGHDESIKIKDYVIAEAVVVHSLYQKMIINFYSQFIKDSYPTRYFTDTDKAKLWLESF